MEIKDIRKELHDIERQIHQITRENLELEEEYRRGIEANGKLITNRYRLKTLMRNFIGIKEE